ncbi:MAG: hypothetical protein QNK23_16545 [Crocinitomicaceae bacterium]|nr:hypothetical protein [Crocinitomicaceae bacterium]
MKKKGLQLLFLFVCLTTMSFGQKILTLEGDEGFDFIVGQTTVNVEFDYSDYGVGDYDSEDDYVKKKVADGNKKEPGKGDKWKESWFGARERVYQPKFMKLINKGLEKKNITFVEGAEDADYTLIVKTTFIEPGYNIGISSRPSSVNFQYIFVDAEGNVVAKLSQKGVPGSQAAGFDFDTSTRVSESYAKAGKMLAGHIYKKIKKK